MSDLINLLVGESTSFDVYFLSRIIVYCTIFDFISIVFKTIGKFR